MKHKVIIFLTVVCIGLAFILMGVDKTEAGPIKLTHTYVLMNS